MWISSQTLDGIGVYTEMFTKADPQFLFAKVDTLTWIAASGIRGSLFKECLPAGFTMFSFLYLNIYVVQRSGEFGAIVHELREFHLFKLQ